MKSSKMLSNCWLRVFSSTLPKAGLMGMPGHFYQHHLSPSLSPTKAWRRGGQGVLDGAWAGNADWNIEWCLGQNARGLGALKDASGDTGGGGGMNRANALSSFWRPVELGGRLLGSIIWHLEFFALETTVWPHRE